MLDELVIMMKFVIIAYFIMLMIFVIATKNSSKSPKFCHTELSQESEVSINLKCDFSALRRILISLDFSPFCKSSKQQKQISLRLHLIKPFVSKAGGRVVFIAGFAVVALCQSLVPAFVVFAKCEASLA